MTKCRDCGKKRLVWVTAGNGKSVLYELGPPHFVRCPKHIAASAKKAGAASANPDAADAVLALEGLGIKEREAKRFVGAGPGDTETLIREALNRREKEKHAKAT